MTFNVNAVKQPYMGEYFDISTDYTTSRVIFSTKFSGTVPLNIPAGNWIGSVISSAAGTSTTNISGNTYQNGFQLFNNCSVIWTQNIFNKGNWWYHGRRVNVGVYNAIIYYGRMDIYLSSGTYYCDFACYAYPTQSSYNNDQPTVTTNVHAVYSQTNDRCLITGKTYTNIAGTYYWIKYTQAGIEASYAPTNAWDINNDHIGYMNSQGYWHYDAGTSTRGPVAFVTYDSTTPYFVGGLDLKATVNGSPWSDGVNWQGSTSEQADGSSLWLTQGTPATPPSIPFS
ncbi:MAG: hypothetical protein ABSA11_12160 [Candidatus Bathyarchaeia archaeon]|jgi:hypothetical protein